MEPTVTQEWMDQPSIPASNQLEAPTTVTDEVTSMMKLNMNEAGQEMPRFYYLLLLLKEDRDSVERNAEKHEFFYQRNP